MIPIEEIRLYKRGSGGKIKVWCIEVANAVDGKVYERTTTGYLNMKMKTTSKITSGDAEKKANTKADKKRREGYKDTIEEATEAGETLSGMQAMFMSLDEAKKFVDDRHKQGKRSRLIVDFKYNGLRGTYHYDADEIISKGNKVYNVEHLRKELRVLCEVNHVEILDFEMYAHGLPVNEIASLVKNTGKDQTKLNAYLFDVLENKDDKSNARDRKKRLDLLSFKFCDHIYVATSTSITSAMDLQFLYNSAIQSVYEGLVIRDPEEPYDWDNKGRRSTVMIKVKPLYSSEFLCVGCNFEKRKVNDVWYDLIMYICETEGGDTFTVTPEGDFSTRNVPCPELDENSWYTIEYRELTTKGIPFHAVGKGFRISEDLDV